MLCSPTLRLIRDSHTIDNLADILSIKHNIALVLEADIDFLHPVVMRDGVLNGSESSLGMENLVADFVVGIGVAFFDTSESLGGGLRVERIPMSFVQIGVYIELGNIISVVHNHRFSKGPHFTDRVRIVMAACGIGTDHFAGPLPVIPMECPATGVTNVSLQMSDINIVMNVLMPDNIDCLSFSGGRIVEKLTVESEHFRLNIAVVSEEPLITIESDRQRCSVEFGFLVQLADDGADIVLAPGFRDSRHRCDSFQYFSDS